MKFTCCKLKMLYFKHVMQQIDGTQGLEEVMLKGIHLLQVESVLCIIYLADSKYSNFSYIA